MRTEMTPKTLGTLQTLAWGMQHFGGLISGGSLRRRDVMRLVKLGLARSLGMVTVCDDDGFALEPEREREGFALTEAGQAVLDAAQKAEEDND